MSEINMSIEDIMNALSSIKDEHDLKMVGNLILTILRNKLPPRSSAIIMLGMPEGDSHDMFYANHFGPCLSLLGLLEHSSKELRPLIKFTR